jgi:hypothetical protein
MDINNSRLLPKASLIGVSAIKSCFRAISICVPLLALHYSSANASAICLPPDKLAPNVTLVLQSAFEKGDGFFEGTFELENRDIKPQIQIPGDRDVNDFFVYFPDAAVEFRDLNGSWVRLITAAPGTYLASSHKLEIKKNSKAIFKTPLFSKQIGGLSGTDFRLVIRLFRPDRCIVSETFRAFPERQPVTHIEAQLPR